jgi:type II secretory pathway component PulM
MHDRLRPLARHLAPARQWLREGTTRWRALSARDRLAVGGAALVLTLAVLWLGLAKPALDNVARWQRDLPKLRAQSAELDQVLSGVPTAQPLAGASASSESPQASLDRAGLQGRYRIDLMVTDAPPTTGKAPPAKAWRIEFTGPVAAATLFPWLLAVSARADLELTGAVLDRTDSAAAASDPAAGPQGHVRGVVDLQSTPHYKDGP